MGATLLILLYSSFFGDPTDPANVRGVGAKANFGAGRAAVVPMPSAPFEGVKPLTTRDLGRLVRVSGTAQTGVRGNAMWVRTDDGRRILVQFEPPPPAGAMARFAPNSRVILEGYLQDIALAEFTVKVDSLSVTIPRSDCELRSKGAECKFGYLPDSTFARVDSLFVKNFYLSVRPDAIGRSSVSAAPAQPLTPIRSSAP